MNAQGKGHVKGHKHVEAKLSQMYSADSAKEPEIISETCLLSHVGISNLQFV